MDPNLQQIIDNPDLLAHATPEELSYIEKQLRAEVALRSPIDYEEYDDPTYVRGAVHELISEKIVALVEGRLLKPNGKPYKKLMIKTPPQIGKSTLGTKATGAWLLTKYPDLHVMSLSYNADFAGTFGRAIRDKIERNADLFGINVAKDKRSVVDFAIEGHKGDLLAVGLGGGVTGHPADVILIDDPIKNAEEALSQRTRDTTFEAYGSAVKSRIRPHTLQIFIYTHWHGDDVGQRVKDNEPDDWYELVIPALATEEDDPLGRPLGEGIWPGPPFHLDREWYESLREQTIPWIWSALYQQHPTIDGAGIFHKEHIRYAKMISKNGVSYIRLLMPEDTPNFQDYPLDKCWSFGTADLAATQKTYSDFTAIGSYYITPNLDLVQVNQFHKRVDSADHEGLIDRFMAQYKMRFCAVENKVFGITLIQTMIRKGKRVRKSEADTDKVARALQAAIYMQAGRIYFLAGEPWLDDFFEELLIFDKGAHDDQVDCLAYAARILAEHEKHQLYPSRRPEPKDYSEKFWRHVEKKTKSRRKYTEPDF